MVPRKEQGTDPSPGSCSHSSNILELSVVGYEGEPDMDPAIEGLTVWQLREIYEHRVGARCEGLPWDSMGTWS